MIIDRAEQELMEKGDISLSTADGLYEAFMLDVQFQERVNYISWYLLVLEKLRQGDTGTFVSTLPFIWLASDVFSVIRECLRTLPLKYRINEIVAPSVPSIDIPGCYVSRTGRYSLVLLRAGLLDRVYPNIDILFDVNLPGLEKWARNDVSYTSFESLFTCCMMESAIKKGISAGAVFFSSENKWQGAAPFCRKKDFEIFSLFLSPDIQALKSEILKRGNPVERPVDAVKIFMDCNNILSTSKGVIININNEHFLFPGQDIKEILIQGFTSYIDNSEKWISAKYSDDIVLER